MSKVFTIGESLLDIIFKNKQPVQAVAGGSMFNTAVSLGRLNLDISHITEIGNDNAGNIIEEFSINNNIKIDYFTKYNSNQTALALAFLDDNNNANYSFYKNNPKDRNLKCPDFKENDILLFGSIYSITKELRKPIITILNEAKKANTIIIYDPNFRINHLKELNEVKDFITENIEYATIIKASDEDVENIFGTTNFNDVYSIIKNAGCNNLIITENKKGVSLITKNAIKKYKVPEILPISTIGAGDSFNAGIIYALNKNNISINNIDIMEETLWNEIIESGISFATDVCLSYENYISNKMASSYLSNNNEAYK